LISKDAITQFSIKLFSLLSEDITSVIKFIAKYDFANNHDILLQSIINILMSRDNTKLRFNAL